MTEMFYLPIASDLVRQAVLHVGCDDDPRSKPSDHRSSLPTRFLSMVMLRLVL
jgi:hypothetical protein